MALDQKIYELRREKLKQIEALGQQAYPYRYETTHTVPQILDEFSAKTASELESPRVEVQVAGRLMSIRVQGKAGFAHLQQGGRLLVAAGMEGERQIEERTHHNDAQALVAFHPVTDGVLSEQRSGLQREADHNDEG